MLRSHTNIRLWILATICSLPVGAGLAMISHTPSDLFSMEIHGTPSHEISMDGELSIGPAQFAMRCEGSGEVKGPSHVREQMLCDMSGEMDRQAVEMSYEFRFIDGSMYMRLRSMFVNGKPMSDPRVARIVGLWILLPDTPPPDPSKKKTPEQQRQSAEDFLRVSDKIFTMDNGPLSNGQTYILHLRKDAWQPVIAAALASQPGPVIVDPGSVDIHVDMRLDMDKGHTLKLLEFQAKAEALLTGVPGKEETLPLLASFRGRFRSTNAAVTVERPATALPAESVFVRYSTKAGASANVYDGFGNMLPSDIPIKRGVYPLDSGLYLVVTRTQVILFDAVEGKIVRTAPR